jgi:hypothetical protein
MRRVASIFSSRDVTNRNFGKMFVTRAGGKIGGPLFFGLYNPHA